MMNVLSSRFLFFLLNILSCATFAAPGSFVYQGQIIQPDGLALEATNVTFTIEVVSPGTEQCILYREQHTLNMTGSNGVFSLEVGDGSRAGSDFADTSTLAESLNNSSAPLTGLTCSSGTTYTPTLIDSRQLRVTFDEGSGPVTLAQNHKIVSVPFAQSAASINGLNAADLLLQRDQPGTYVLNQANLENVFSDSNYTELLALLNGTSSSFSSGPSPGDITEVLTGATSGLSGGVATGSANLQINVDNSTVEISGNNLQVKDAGVTNAKLALDAVTSNKILDDSITNADINSGAAIARTKLANGAVNSLVINNGTGVMSDLSIAPNQVLVSDANGLPSASATVDNTELGYLDGVTSSIQTQLNSAQSGLTTLTADKVAKAGDAMTGALSITGSADAVQLGVRANATQTVNILELKNSAGAVTGSFRADGTETTATDLTTKSYVDAAVSGADSIQDSDGNTMIQVEEGANDDTIRFDTAGIERMVIDSSGNVGVGTTTPRAKLDVNGAIAAAPAVTDAAGTINFASSNFAYSASSCGAFTLYNMKDGATYTLAIQGTAAATCSFTAHPDDGTAGTPLSVKLPPSHGATTGGAETLYSFVVIGTRVYVSWVPGYTP